MPGTQAADVALQPLSSTMGVLRHTLATRKQPGTQQQARRGQFLKPHHKAAAAQMAIALGDNVGLALMLAGIVVCIVKFWRFALCLAMIGVMGEAETSRQKQQRCCCHHPCRHQ